MSNRPTTLGLVPSFGFGDRLGLATPGHIRALQAAGEGIRPVFAQQSTREMERTNRQPESVLADAAEAVERVGYDGPWAADADHLKREADIDATAAAGFTFFTLDPSDFVRPEADGYDLERLEAELQRADGQMQRSLDSYLGKRVRLGHGLAIQLDRLTVYRAALKYGGAIKRTIELARHLAQVMAAAGRDHELEVSVDETQTPTSLAEHYIIAEELQRAEVKFVSLAPRFVGEFEKGVDYKGDLAQFERSLRQHAVLARQLGPYKLSLHSGSDKLTIYPLLARLTRGMFHVKTAGTSYLEALRVAARHEPELFRSIIQLARDRYEADRATYHVSCRLDDVPVPGAVADCATLERIYLGDWRQVPDGQGLRAPGRQILHVTFGSVLADATLGRELYCVLQTHATSYAELLAYHFGRHLEALRAGL